MKKNVIIGLLALMGIALTGCQTNAPCNFHKKTVDMPVQSSEWQFDKDLQQFYVRFTIDWITSDVYNYGEFSVHREYNSGTKDAYQVALPQSQYLWENVQDSTGTETTVYYQQLVDYRIGVGYVEIQVTNSDYFYGDYKPEDMLFRLQLTY